MSAPTNTSPATAIDITSLPYEFDLVDVDLAGDGVSNIPSCVGSANNAVWFKYTAPAGVKWVFLRCCQGLTSNSGYNPSTSVWVGTESSLSIYTITDGASDDQTYCDNLTDTGTPGSGVYYKMPVTPGETYWIQCVQDGGSAPSGSVLQVSMVRGELATAPAGSAVITDDTDSFPAAVISRTTGSYLTYIDIPAGEQTDTIVGGNICTQNGSNDQGIVILDGATLDVIASYDFSPLGVTTITSNRRDKFYVLISSFGSPPYTLKTYDAVTGAELSSVTVAGSEIFRLGMVAQDDSAFYFGRRNSGVHRFDLINPADGSIMSTINVQAAIGLGLEFFLTGKCAWTLSNGDLCFPATDFSSTYKLVRTDSSGALVQAYPVPPPATKFNRLWYVSETDFIVWSQDNSFHNYLQWVQYSDGSTVNFLPFETSGSSRLAPENDTTAWASNSCPIFVLPQTIEGPEPPCIPPTITAQPQGATIIAGQTAHLSVTVEDEGVTYQWYIGESGDTSDPIEGATNATLDVSPAMNTLYWCRVTRN